jgi:glutamate-5-semialdehyde dehydrogenase
VDVRQLVETEARAAGRAAPLLADEPVAAALGMSAALARERHAAILAANRADYEAAAARLDEGTLDRLRLDADRVEALARQLEATAALPPLERDVGSRTLANGLRVSERRAPIGTVGANFEARPNVAVDVAG